MKNGCLNWRELDLIPGVFAKHFAGEGGSRYSWGLNPPPTPSPPTIQTLLSSVAVSLLMSGLTVDILTAIWSRFVLQYF